MAWSAAELAGQLRDLGLGTGDTVLVHSSMRAIGEVSGGAAGVVEAIRRTIGGAGTLMVPTFTEENSKSSRAHTRQVEGLSEQQVEQFRAQMPAFDTAATPSATGWISELVRLTPGAVRSSHPVTSFTALGPEARRLVSGHALDSYHGERSPLGRLNETAGARVLLAGVGYEACSPFHLAEHALPDPPRTTYQFVIDGGGGRHWAADLSGR
jgi:aminoglycoside 3-N-acetyltransferase